MAIYNCGQCGAIVPYSGAPCPQCARRRADEQRWRNQSSSLSSYVSNGSSSYTSGTYSASSYRPDNFTGRKSQKFTDGSRYFGDFVEGKRHGKGTNYFTDGSQYEGDFKNGYMNGYGVMVYADGEKYEGEWTDGKRHGQGTYFYENGEKYEGEWADGDRHGKGTYYYVNPTGKYVGDYYKDVRRGFGIEDIHVPEGTQHYEGEWQNGKRHGKGKMICVDGSSYEGEYKEGMRYGRGKCVLPDGTVQDGYFENGEFVGEAESAYESIKQKEAVPTSQVAAKDTDKEIWDKLVGLSVAERNEFLASHPNITVPAGVEKIPQSMFSNCLNLKNIRFNEDLREIDAYAFSGCKNLCFTLVIPSSVERVRKYAFSCCNAVKRVILPNNIYIEECAFMCGGGLSEVEFETEPPKGIVLEKGAFRYCDIVMSKEMKKKIKDIGAKAFK